MSWAGLDRVMPFAGFLAERLQLARIEIVADDVAKIPSTAGHHVDVIEPRRALGSMSSDALPVIVAPWSKGTTLSASGRVLLTLGDCYELVLVVEPLGIDPSVDSVMDLRERLGSCDLAAPLLGDLTQNDGTPIGSIAVVESQHRPLSPVVEVPDAFTVIAFMTVYNEIDILARSVEDMREQGVGVYIRLSCHGCGRTGVRSWGR